MVSLNAFLLITQKWRLITVAFLLCTLPVLPQAAACSLELFTSLILFFRSLEPLSGSSGTPPCGLAFETPAMNTLRPSALEGGRRGEGGCSPHSDG